MGKYLYGFSGMILLLGALLISGAPSVAKAGVNVGVNVNLGPPPIVVAEPPEMVPVPRSQAYFVPGLEFDVFFYNGFWWSPRGDHWYRARAYNGPWRTVARRNIPGPVLRIPHDYRHVYARERHIPYREWRERRGRGEHREMREMRHERREYNRERGGHWEGDGQRGHGHEH
jgi:hypothetical protein